MHDRIDELEIEGEKSGRDEFSSLRLAALKDLFPKEFEQIAIRIAAPEDQAVALRWVGRKQSVELAIVKAEYEKQRRFCTGRSARC